MTSGLYTSRPVNCWTPAGVSLMLARALPGNEVTTAVPAMTPIAIVKSHTTDLFTTPTGVRVGMGSPWAVGASPCPVRGRPLADPPDRHVVERRPAGGLIHARGTGPPSPTFDIWTFRHENGSKQ